MPLNNPIATGGGGPHTHPISDINTLSTALVSTQVDGGSAASLYQAEQIIDGGGA